MAGLTLKTLAHAAGVDRSDVSQLERDKMSPTIQMLFRLGRSVQTRPFVLIKRLEQQGPYPAVFESLNVWSALESRLDAVTVPT